MFATWRTRAVLTRAMVLTAGLSLTASLAGCHSAPPPKDHLVAATPGASADRPTSATAAATGAVPPATGAASPATGAVPPAIGAGCPAAPYGARLYAPGSAKTVALTFDDGPGRSTAAILAILASYQVTATFFNIGVAMAARPWTLELAQQGRMGVDVVGRHLGLDGERFGLVLLGAAHHPAR